MSKIRVLVVEDSLTVRMRLIEILAGDPDIEIVGEAADGKSAIALCLQHRPDVITMDMMLPVMTGLAATEYIMAHCPTPILIVSASVNRGELFRTYEALAAGAVDVLEKPTGAEPDGVWESSFLAILKMVARIRVITHPRGRLADKLRAPGPAKPLRKSAASRFDLVAIGASTGGPGAIVDILRGLPAAFRLPIVFVLHINEPFGTSFAEWLDGLADRPVAYAREGDPVISAAGRVVMAPAGKHLVIRDGRFHLTLDPERHSCRPSVDALFESVAAEYGAAAIGCLLTGMGRDGAEGLLALRRAGAMTIAQDEATAVVYGMPREAVRLNAASEILPLPQIAARLNVLESVEREAGR